MRPLSLIAAFLVGLAVTCAGLRVLARRNPSESHGMLEHLAAHGEDYDLVVIGPSFTRLHFIPPVFEARMAELGHPLRAFGFGMSGMRGGELDYYVERVLSLPMPNLRWVLCDVTLDQVRPLNRGNWYKRRVIAWHGPAQLRLLQRVIWSQPGDTLDKLEEIWPDVMHLLLNLANIGEGIEALRADSWFGQPPPILPRWHFFPHRQSPARQAASSARYMRHARGHAKATRRLKIIRKRGDPPPRGNLEMTIWRDRIRAHGQHAAFILSPILSDAHIETAVPGDEPLRVLDFNDPLHYSELYDPTLRHDRSHFHYGGAELFSRRLAEAFAQMLERENLERPRTEDTTARSEH